MSKPMRTKILRFRKTERHVHWAIAIPFLVCYLTALVKIVVYHPNPQLPYRELFCRIHRGAGLCLIVLPMLAVLGSTGDFRVHFQNILQAWRWTLDDLKWLLLTGLAAISKRVKLPDAGKFNAAEKLNFMMLMTTYPLYIVTGLIMWLTDMAFVSWVVHATMGIIATPLLFGHLFMALVNPSTRRGLEGMTSGYVDREWAEHHYGKWYREQIEERPEATSGAGQASVPAVDPERRRGQEPATLVRELLSGRRTAQEICLEHGIEEARLDEWVDRFVEAGTLALMNKPDEDELES